MKYRGETEGNGMIVNVITWSVVLLLGILCMWTAMRAFGRESVTLRGRTIALEKNLGLTGDRFTPKMGIAAICWGIGVLCALYGASVIFCFITRDNASWSTLSDVWMRWDAPHYRDLAELGYHNYTDGEHLFLVFFPLYPWLIHLLAQLIPDYLVCGHLLSALCYIAACYMLARLATEEFGRHVGALSLALFSAYPCAFFFAAYYTESLFVLLTLTCFYCIRKHRYLLAGIVGALCALTRMQGFLLAAVALVEYGVTEHPLRKWREKNWRGLALDLGTKLIPIGIMAVGLGIYLWLNYSVDGNPFQFMIYQREHWTQGFLILPNCLRTIWEYFIGNLSREIGYTTWAAQLSLFVVCIAVVIYGIRRLPITWITYFLLVLMMNYSLSYPLSIVRYMATSFPLHVTIAIGCRKRPMLGYFIMLICTIIQGAFFITFLQGHALY